MVDEKIIEQYKRRLLADRARQKKYYTRNKETIAQKRKEHTITCRCGGRYYDSPAISSRHMKSKKHQRYLEGLVNDLPEEVKELII